MRKIGRNEQIFKCYYRGTVYNGPAPGTKLLIPETVLSN